MKKIAFLFVILSLYFYAGELKNSYGASNEKNDPRLPVVFIHGGAIDDNVSYLLLTTMRNVDVKAVIVTNTDSVVDYAVQTQWKTQIYINDSEMPVGLSSARGWNSFPWLYRSDSIRQNNIEVFSEIKDKQDWPPFPSGDKILNEILSAAVKEKTPVTVLITCPITTVSDLLKKNPGLEKGIERLIWMGGAIRVKGNLDKDTIPAEVANSEAEWNVFWDPYGVDWIFNNTSFPIYLFPLDVTNQVPLTQSFKKKLQSQAADFRYSRLTHQSYQLTVDEPFYEMWNTVTTAYLDHPEFFDEPTPLKLNVITGGFNQGALKINPNGRLVNVIFNIQQKERFYEYVLEQFKRNQKK